MWVPCFLIASPPSVLLNSYSFDGWKMRFESVLLMIELIISCLTFFCIFMYLFLYFINCSVRLSSYLFERALHVFGRLVHGPWRELQTHSLSFRSPSELVVLTWRRFSFLHSSVYLPLMTSGFSVVVRKVLLISRLSIRLCRTFIVLFFIKIWSIWNLTWHK